MAARQLLYIAPRHIDAAVCEQLPAHQWEVHVAQNISAARRLLGEHPFLVGLFLLPEFDAASCAEIDELLQAHEAVEWVGAFKPASLQLPSCRDLVLERLFDHLTLPVDSQRLAATLGHAYGRAALRLGCAGRAAPHGEGSIVGQSLAMARLQRQINRIAKADAPALICGESGSGKELVAQAIHTASRRASGPFVVVNCGAIPAALIQSELFGHEKGSFTGAGRQTRGLIETASGGTVFLDEIGDLPLDLQTNLLRFLQESTIDRVGSARAIHVDVRVIAATNVDLESAVGSGAFRKDLFYRLNVLPISVPPLRERGGDVELLAQHFFLKLSRDRNRTLKGFSRRAMMAMGAHDWPGNVRELINRIHRAMVLTEGKLIMPPDLGLEHLDEPVIRLPLGEARLNAERHAIYGSLECAGKNVSYAAKQLGISRMTLYRLMAKHRISA